MKSKQHQMMGALGLLVSIGATVATPSVRAADSTETAADARLDALEKHWANLQAEMAEMRAALQALQAATAGSQPQAAVAGAAVEQRLNAVEAYAQTLNTQLTEVKTTVDTQEQTLTASSEARSRALALSSYGTFVAGKHAGQNSTLSAESFEIVLSGQPHDRIGFFSELEFERAANIGGPRGGEALLEQAYVDFSIIDALALRAGVVLVPFGNVVTDHYAPLRDTITKPLSSFAIAPSSWSDNGLGVVGDTDLSKQWHLNYEAYLVTGLGADIRAAGLRNARQGFGSDNNGDKAVVAHVGFNYLDNLTLGLAAYRGAYDDAGQLAMAGFGLDFSWTLADLKLTGELMRMDAERAVAADTRYWGGYVRSSYDVSQVLPENLRGKSFPDARLALVYEYDYVDIGNLDPAVEVSRREWRHTLGFKYEPTRSWIFKFNYETSRAANLPVVNGNDHAWLTSIGYVF